MSTISRHYRDTQAIFDRQVVSARCMDRILRQFEHNFKHIYTQDLERFIASLGNLHQENLAQLASWNTCEVDPRLQHYCVHHANHGFGKANRLSVRGMVTLIMRTFVTCHPPRQDIFNAAVLAKKLWCLYF